MQSAATIWNRCVARRALGSATDADFEETAPRIPQTGPNRRVQRRRWIGRLRQWGKNVGAHPLFVGIAIASFEV